jgi:hypothetical protein
MFDFAEDFVVDAAFVAEAHGGSSFDAEKFAKDTGGVVDRAFIDDALWEAEALGNGGGGNGVSGGDDGAQDEAQPPVKAGEDPGGGPRHTEHGEAYKAEGEQENTDEVEF